MKQKFDKIYFIQNRISNIKIQNSNKHLLNVAIVGIFAIHLVSCMFLYLAFIKNFGEDTWIQNIHEENDTIFERYIIAIYWTV